MNKSDIEVLQKWIEMHVVSDSSVTVGTIDSMRKLEAVNFANASVRLEGFEPSVKALQRSQLFVQGHLNLSDLNPKLR